VAVKYWLFKSEPTAYSFDDLVQDGTAEWDGVRNFQVRNWLRDEIKAGDQLLFYYSNTKVIGVVGTATVVRDGYPDDTAWDPKSEHPDQKSTPDSPIWYMVDIQAGLRFAETVTPVEMRSVAELREMVVLKKGNRLSITPVTAEEFGVVKKIGMAK
jgi:predicted RNA-binding protein with PUA-like domain